MKRILILILFLLESIIAGNIKGRVTNFDSGEPLEYVSIFLKGSNLETITDSNGYFKINNIPNGEYILSIPTMLHEKYEETYKFDSYSNNYEIKIRLKKVVPFIPRDSLIENYHLKFNKLEIDEVLNINIDSCKVMHSSIYAYSTFENKSDYPIYLIKNYELLASVIVDVYVDDKLISPGIIRYTDTMGMKLHPNSSDIIVIKPHSSIKYPPIISTINVCENNKNKYEIKLRYSYNRPEMIYGIGYTSGADAFYRSYKDNFYSYNIAFRGQVESANKILIECGNK